jgi:hypothetical protein
MLLHFVRHRSSDICGNAWLDVLQCVNQLFEEEFLDFLTIFAGYLPSRTVAALAYTRVMYNGYLRLVVAVVEIFPMAFNTSKHPMH